MTDRVTRDNPARLGTPSGTDSTNSPARHSRVTAWQVDVHPQAGTGPQPFRRHAAFRPPPRLPRLPAPIPTPAPAPDLSAITFALNVIAPMFPMAAHEVAFGQKLDAAIEAHEENEGALGAVMTIDNIMAPVEALICSLPDRAVPGNESEAAFRALLDTIEALPLTRLLTSAPVDVPVTSPRAAGLLFLVEARSGHCDLPLSMLSEIASEALALPDDEPSRVISEVAECVDQWLEAQLERIQETFGSLRRSSSSSSASADLANAARTPSRTTSEAPTSVTGDVDEISSDASSVHPAPIGSASVVLDAYLRFFDSLPAGVAVEASDSDMHPLPGVLYEVAAPRPDQALAAIRRFYARYPDPTDDAFVAQLQTLAARVLPRLAVDDRLPIIDLLLDGYAAAAVGREVNRRAARDLQLLLGTIEQHQALLEPSPPRERSAALSASIVRRQGFPPLQVRSIPHFDFDDSELPEDGFRQL